MDAQLQKQEILDTHITSQITGNNSQIQSSIQEFQQSLQPIYTRTSN